MAFNKEAFLIEAKVKLNLEGKEYLSDFIEDIAIMGWEVLKLAAKHSDTLIDDMVATSMDSTVKGLVDKINGKEDL